MIKLNVAWPPPARYILAVSGGADSMVLLDLMAAAAPARGYDLVVAHLDHGMRPGSGTDCKFVRTAARQYGLTFESALERLGPEASEATARAARHHWLQSVCAAHRAAAVITAHHQDDRLETSLLNLARGSGRRGLAPMPPGAILRPLIGLTRAHLRNYATAHGITWREDPTNANVANPRNFLRHQLLPHATPAWTNRYLKLLDRLTVANQAINQDVAQILAPARAGQTKYLIPASTVQALSLDELAEVIATAALTLKPGLELGHRLLAELALFAKTGRSRRRRPLPGDLWLIIKSEHIELSTGTDTTNSSS